MKHHKTHKSIIIAAGGTGGHIFPALAISYYLVNNSDYKPTFITDTRGDNFIDDSYHFLKRIVIPTTRFQLGVSLVTSIPSFIKSTLKMISELRVLKPVAVLGFGGYASFPVLLASVFLGIPIILHESNAVIGRTNRYFLPFCSKIMLSFANTQRIDENYLHKVVVTGTPVRKNILQLSDHELQHKKNEVKILVIGGSQGSKIISEIVPQAISKLSLELRNQLIVWQQTRPEQVDSANATYNKSNLKKFFVATFFPDTSASKDPKSISSLMQQADLVIARAGASTISEITTLGKASLLIPFAEAKDNHQHHNAKNMVESGAAIMVEEGEGALEKLIKALEILITDVKLRNKMGGKALTNLHAQSPETMMEIIKTITEQSDLE